MLLSQFITPFPPPAVPTSLYSIYLNLYSYAANRLISISFLDFIYVCCCYCLDIKSCLTLQPARLLSPCNSPGKNTRVGCCFLLQGIFPTQGWNLGLPHCRQTLLSESPGKPLFCVKLKSEWGNFAPHSHSSIPKTFGHI